MFYNSRALIVFFAAIIFSAAMYAAVPGNETPYIIVFSGAGMKAPVTEIATNFENETGIRVLLFFDGSSVLRNYIVKFRRGDIFLSGDEENIKAVGDKGMLEKEKFVAWHIVSILVSPNYHAEVTGLDDLARPGIRLAISNPKMASLGKLVMERIIKRHPKGQDILNNVAVYSSSTADTLSLYQKGNIDAIIEWDVMAQAPEGKGLIAVDIEEEFQIKDPLKVGLLKTSKNPGDAERFFDYFTTKGLDVFRKHGYRTGG